ncbi:hypothetical protein SR1949_14580 [Sphaerospermopsis reniformis]|uniref:DUF202 domain-containing protein n=1 Tax=Sphaerospermopsis reniformis TaxID=531300 RepID=A0A479ZUU0_9CYAN|nr:cytochrome P450 [Sphaerospermopsis reniformis]GCL36355.1 hypothetical protein SR1949_14580 [Sphaerospermopsis reniformis]
MIGLSTLWEIQERRQNKADQLLYAEIQERRENPDPSRTYLVLGLSFVLGASISILVRETISIRENVHPPLYQRLITQFTACLLLSVSIYGFVDLIRSL